MECTFALHLFRLKQLKMGFVVRVCGSLVENNSLLETANLGFGS